VLSGVLSVTFIIHNMRTTKFEMLLQSDLHEVLENVYRYEDCSSAIHGRTSVYSHLICWKVYQLRQDSLRMELASPEMHRIMS